MKNFEYTNLCAKSLEEEFGILIQSTIFIWPSFNTTLHTIKIIILIITLICIEICRNLYILNHVCNAPYMIAI
jgi:hypothetical protein